jgi:hypothetical protein
LRERVDVVFGDESVELGDVDAELLGGFSGGDHCWFLWCH